MVQGQPVLYEMVSLKKKGLEEELEEEMNWPEPRETADFSWRKLTLLWTSCLCTCHLRMHVFHTATTHPVSVQHVHPCNHFNIHLSGILASKSDLIVTFFLSLWCTSHCPGENLLTVPNHKWQLFYHFVTTNFTPDSWDLSQLCCLFQENLI